MDDEQAEDSGPQPARVSWEQKFQLNLNMHIPSNRTGLEFHISTPGYDTLDAALDAVFHAVDRINAKWDDQAEVAVRILQELGAEGVLSVRGQARQFASQETIERIAAQFKKEK